MAKNKVSKEDWLAEIAASLPPPIQDGDLTVYASCKILHVGDKHMKAILDAEVAAGKAIWVTVSGRNGLPVRACRRVKHVAKKTGA